MLELLEPPSTARRCAHILADQNIIDLEKVAGMVKAKDPNADMRCLFDGLDFIPTEVGPLARVFMLICILSGERGL